MQQGSPKAEQERVVDLKRLRSTGGIVEKLSEGVGDGSLAVTMSRDRFDTLLRLAADSGVKQGEEVARLAAEVAEAIRSHRTRLAARAAAVMLVSTFAVTFVFGFDGAERKCGRFMPVWRQPEASLVHLPDALLCPSGALALGILHASLSTAVIFAGFGGLAYAAHRIWRLGGSRPTKGARIAYRRSEAEFARARNLGAAIGWAAGFVMMFIAEYTPPSDGGRIAEVALVSAIAGIFTALIGGALARKFAERPIG